MSHAIQFCNKAVAIARNCLVANEKQRLVIGTMLLAASASSVAEVSNVVVTVGELDTAIENLDKNPDAIERMVLAEIENALTDADLQLSEGDLVFSDTSENLIDDSSCTRTEVRSMTTTAVLNADTSLAFSLKSVNDPIEINLNVIARVNAIGRAKQTIGFRLGSCQELATDSFSFTASGDFDLSLRLRLELNPTLETDMQRLLLRPVISLTGTLQSQNVRVNVDDSILRNALERVIEKQLDDALDNSELVTSLASLQADLQGSLDSEMDDGVLTVELPEPDDEQVSRLYTLLSPVGDFSLSLGYLRTKRVELLAALITGNDSAVDKLLSNAALCEAAGLLQTTLPHPPLYELGESGCAIASLNQSGASDSTQGLLFKDQQCLLAFDYQASSTSDYCSYVLDTERLGNAAANTSTLDSWTLSPGTRFDIGALPLLGLQQPFTQRTQYKQVTTLQGECSLEMRIHTVRPQAVNSQGAVSDGSAMPAQLLQPLIAFHGGSWQRRSSGALGIEAVATQFANQGYVVFVPFYRLIETEEGNAACNGATLTDLLDDASDALDWVQQNSARYGAEGKPVVFGQSAGGHLSAVLAVERPDEIASAVLFYAPTDFTDFANQIFSGEVDSVTGQRILETVVGQTLDTLNVNSPLIIRNTLTTRIVDNAIDTPPFFLVHGLEDKVLPYQQSVRMCDALTGNPDAGPAASAVAAVSDDPFRRVVNCGFYGSELHLITEGEHALDLCVAEELCLSGSPLSAEKTADSVQRMLDWLGEMNAAHYAADENDVDDDFSGGIAANDAGIDASDDLAVLDAGNDVPGVSRGSANALLLLALCLCLLRPGSVNSNSKRRTWLMGRTLP